MRQLVYENVVAAPAPQLRGIVARYKGFRYSGSAAETQHALPSRYVTLVVSLDRPIEILDVSHGKRTTAASLDMLVAGLRTRPTIMRDHGESCGVIAQLEPRRAASLFGVPASTLVGQVADLSDLWDRAPELRERLGAARTWNQRFTVLDELFARTLRDEQRLSPEVGRAWSRLVATGGTAKIADLAAEVGWNRRRLLDRFQSVVGLGPKQLARILRFERACGLLEQASHAGLAAVAARCGYYDQAHMASEWRALAGMTATDWMALELRDPPVEAVAV